ncbi:MAG TPA: hypothetical protein V6D19_05720 [Stenomitos sp.]
MAYLFNPLGKSDFFQVVTPSAIYVDSAVGSDSNSGREATAPKQTLAAALAILKDGQTLYLERGSTWRETLNLTGFNSVKVEPYGTGLKPIVSAQDVVTSFTQNGGTAAYTFAVTIDTDIVPDRGYAGVFENGSRLTEIKVGDPGIADATAAIAAVVATPGSFYFAGPGSQALGWAAGTKTYYIQATDSSNPNTNGLTYEVYKRQFACIIPETCTAKGIRFHLGWFHDGSGNNLEDCSIERLARHGCLPNVPRFKGCISIDPNPAFPGALFHSNPQTMAADISYEDCIAVGRKGTSGYLNSGFFSHGPGVPVKIRNRATLNRCAAYNVQTGVLLADVNEVNVLDFRAENFTALFGVGDAQKLTLFNCTAVGGEGGNNSQNGSRMVSAFPTNASVFIKNCRFEFRAPNVLWTGTTLGSTDIDDSDIVLHPNIGTPTAFAITSSTNTIPRLQVRNSRLIFLGGGVASLFQALSASNVLFRNVLVVGHKSTLGVPLRGTGSINSVATALTTLDPSAKVAYIDTQRAVVSSIPGNIVLARGVYNPGDAFFNAVAYSGAATNPRQFVAVGDRVATTSSGGGNQIWQIIYTPTAELQAVAFSSNNSSYVAVGNGGLCVRMTGSGLTLSFTPTATGTTNTLRAIAANSTGVVIAVGDAGTVLRSTDNGATWTAITSNTTRTMRGISFNGPTWIAAGDEGRVIRSTDDGLTWAETTQGTSAHYCVYYSVVATLFILGSEGGTIRTTPDGVTWTGRNTPTQNRVVSITDNLSTIRAALYQTSKYPEAFMVSTNATSWSNDPFLCPFEVKGIAAMGSASGVNGDSFCAVGEAQTVALIRLGNWFVQRIFGNERIETGQTYEKWIQAVR